MCPNNLFYFLCLMLVGNLGDSSKALDILFLQPPLKNERANLVWVIVLKTTYFTINLVSGYPELAVEF